MLVMKVLLAVFVFVTMCFATSVTISGTVTDTGGGAISGAAVKLEKGGQTATTDANGSFILSGNSAVIKGKTSQALSRTQSIFINNGLLYVNLQEKSAVDIVAYNLQGKNVSTIHETLGAGMHYIPLHNKGTGVYFYKVKTGNNELVVKNYSIGKVLQGAWASAPNTLSSSTLEKHAEAQDTIDDVIAVTKDGYLDFRMEVTNPDTSGMAIKMIVSAGNVTDQDGNVYQTVKIGNQIWTTENLRVTKYNDGTGIPLDTPKVNSMIPTTPKYCYYDNTASVDSIRKYGALYNWYVVATKKLAPVGWHVPDTADWNELENFLIANGYNSDSTTTGNKIAQSLQAKTDWRPDPYDSGAVEYDLTGNNRSGFSALPGGYLYNSMFTNLKYTGHFWTATEYDTSNAYNLSLGGAVSLDRYHNNKSMGCSIRLLKD
ncbi:MAG TPA: hypothetical protein DCO75_08780 [Fibrobacteres bacterium]|nr:hypothetical protein [Fibrobacterota bacterium]